MDADDGVQFGFVSPAGVASYITIAATMPCVHTATTANILPQSSAPNTGSNIGPSAPRARGDATRILNAHQPATTGLRWGEMAALRVRDIDLGRSRLRIERSASKVNAKKRAPLRAR